MRVGADVIELDLHLSADGEVVAIHDDTVQRTTQGSARVASLTPTELQALDAAYNFTLDEGQSFPHRGTGLQIPTLEQILSAQPEQLFAIELKADDTALASAFASVVAAHEMQAKVFVWSSHVDVTDALRASPVELQVGLNFR